jgi:tRNA dimethylallyltransferase
VTLPPLLVIAGATATGKTGLSIAVAEALAREGVSAEIISADSRQVYRGLDIGTAKASTADRAGVPHHGIDLVEPDEPFTLADFAAHAREALADIASRRAFAILVGGTGLYLRAVARGIDTDALPSDAVLRASLESDLVRDGLPPLVERLQAAAPRRAARTDLRNPRRVVRALEIAELEGDRDTPLPRGYDGPTRWIGLSLGPDAHREWIATRARDQFDAGLVEEARSLRDRFDPTLPAFSAIGYREAWAVIDGAMSVEAAIAEDARRNVGFAKRQKTWFRSEPGIEWLDAEDERATRVAALARVRDLLRPSG